MLYRFKGHLMLFVDATAHACCSVRYKDRYFTANSQSYNRTYDIYSFVHTLFQHRVTSTPNLGVTFPPHRCNDARPRVRAKKYVFVMSI